MIASNVYIYTTTLPVPPRVRRTARMDAWTRHGRNAVSVYGCVSQVDVECRRNDEGVHLLRNSRWARSMEMGEGS